MNFEAFVLERFAQKGRSGSSRPTFGVATFFGYFRFDSYLLWWGIRAFVELRNLCFGTVCTEGSEQELSTYRAFGHIFLGSFVRFFSALIFFPKGGHTLFFQIRFLVIDGSEWDTGCLTDRACSMLLATSCG